MKICIFNKNNLVNRGYYLLQSCLNSFILPCGRFSPKHEILHFPPEVHTSARFAPLRRSAHRGICPLRNLPIVKTKIGASLQLFCGCGLSFTPAKQKAAVIWLITCVFLLQSTIRELATIRNRKKVAVLTDFLFSGSRGSDLGGTLSGVSRRNAMEPLYDGAIGG